MILLVLKFIVAVLIIPLAGSVSIAFYKNAMLIKEIASHVNYFAAGAGIYVVLHLMFYKPTFLYVLGHEAVHAGIAWLFGAKIKAFKVTPSGGSVAADRSNMVIELSPYFVPVYAIIISVMYFMVASSYNVNGSLFVFLIGFFLAFHIIMTVEVMKIRQPDMVKSGYFFSIIFIYVINIIVISVIFGLLFPSFSIKQYFIDSWELSKTLYEAVVKQLFF